MTKLDELRNGIDEVDQKIIELLAQRFQYTEEVGIYKAENHLHSQDVSRENQQFQKIAKLSAQYGLNPDYASEIYRCLIDIVISRHEELLKSTCK
ncbi:chorismate mutase [Paenibacillus chondroitinus]|uniref:Chorismate mutase n=1 Tax=Paenibacillus chondroitinus TaxID=59842 RepID=A0ABU6D506_9BACL|nr:MULTISPECIES: chorismate mutase [Paenibacillus]MCY9658821.1 chorismate mutase [Paenibacillus anseongense]MEB4792819.1 chorismate mutase [Paenibacillus chondroitinus]